MAPLSLLLAILAGLRLCSGMVRRPDWEGEALRIKNLQSATVEKRDSVPAGYVAAPYYPTPLGGWISNWTAAYAKAEIIVVSSS